MTNVVLTWSRSPASDDGIYGDAVTYEEIEGFNRTFRRDLPPGIAEWAVNHENENNHAALVYTCPCGCGAVGCVPVVKENKIEKSWLWDGNVDKPTLSPSIQKTFGCRWHGFLRAGIWEQC